jgi:hypothetical protein
MSCAALLLIVLAEPAFAQNDLTGPERSFLSNVAQARTSVARCGRLAIDEGKIRLAAVAAKVDMEKVSARSFYSQRSSALRALFDKYDREAACAAAMEFYGASGRSMRGLVK